MIEFRRCNSLDELYEIVHLNHLSLVIPDINGLDVGRLVTLLTVDLSQDLILFSVHVKISHALSAQSVLQRFGNIAYVDSHTSCLVAVDVHPHFRAAELQIDIGHLERRIIIYPIQEFRKNLFQLVDTDSLQDILYWHTASTSSKGRLLLDECSGLGLGTDGFGDLFCHLHLGVVTILNIFQSNLDVSASAGYTGGYSCCIRNDGVNQIVDVFRIIADVFVAGSFGSSCTDRNF